VRVVRSGSVMRLAAFAVVTTLLIGLRNGDVLAAPSIDASAPSLVLTDFSGGTFDLSQMRGKVVLINYWAAWCAPCRKEMPILDSFYRQHHDRGLELIGISADHRQDFARMRKVSSALAYPTTSLDRVSDDGFGPPQGFPLTYVIDRQGVVRAQFIDVDDKLLRDVVLPLLGK